MSTPPAKKTFYTGEVLFREGDESTSLFLIQRGAVSIRRRKGQGFVEVARIYAKEVLGELPFFDRNARSATAVAMTDVVVLEIEYEALDKIYAPVPSYLKSIISGITIRLRKANDTIRRLQKELRDLEGEKKGDLDAAAILEITQDFGLGVGLNDELGELSNEISTELEDALKKAKS